MYFPNLKCNCKQHFIENSGSTTKANLTRARQSLDWKSVFPDFEKRRLSLLVGRGASVFAILGSVPLSNSDLSRGDPATSLSESGPFSSSKT